MRYRSLTNALQFSDDVAQYVRLVGEREYWRLLSSLGEGLNKKGYVTETDDLRYSLELELLNLEILRHKVLGRFSGAPSALHQAVDFVVGLAQTIPHLSASARTKLRGQIVGGLKTSGLRSLQHEMRVAGMLSRHGYDVTFSDLEGAGGYDFLASKDGLSYEVEAKSLPIFSGSAILPHDADKLFVEMRRKFDGWQDRSRIPILTITTERGIPVSRPELLKMVATCNTVAATQCSSAPMEEFNVDFTGAFADAPYEKILHAAGLDRLINGVHVYAAQRHPKVVVRLRSKRKSKFPENLVAKIGEAAKRQFSSTKPGVIWTHIDYVDRESFSLLSSSSKGLSLFDRVSNAVFDSPKRNHIIQLVFSGGAFLHKDGEIMQSNYDRVVYDTPHAKFGQPMLFPGGRKRSSV